MIIDVTDPADPRLDVFARLRDAQLRTRLESERGLFVAEGTKIIRRALEAGCKPYAYLLSRRWLRDLDDLVGEVDTFLASERFIEDISGFHIHRGALGVFHRPQEASWELLRSSSRLIVAQGLVDHANLGSILRIGAGLGWDGLLVSHDCADPLYRRAIKASMGASLSLPWRRMRDDMQDLRALRDAGFLLVAATLSDEALDIDHSPAAPKLALLVGNEGHGLPDEWIAAADRSVTIKMERDTDSLNVAAAAAILAHHFRRR